MKKLLAVLLACGLAFQTCAFASVDNLMVTPNDTKLELDATIGDEKDTPVIVAVGDYGVTIDASNLPEYMYLHRTGANGEFKLDVKLRPDIESGKYTVYVTAEDGSKDKKSVMVLNSNDKSKGGTVDVMAELVAAASGSDAEAFAAIFADKNKTSKLGIDPDEAYPLTETLASYMGEVIVGLTLPVDTLDNFKATYNKASAMSALKNGKNIESVMEAYGKEFFDVDYEKEFAELTDDEKKYIASRLSQVDYTDPAADLKGAYADILIVMDYAVIDTWGELRELVLADHESGKIVFNMYAYDNIEDTRICNVYEMMKSNLVGVTTIDGIKKAFEDASYDVYEIQINDQEKEEGSVGDSVWGDNTVYPDVNPNGTTGTRVPAAGNGGSVITDPSKKPQNDIPTEKATPAPTVPPTPAPGEFVDTMDHWAKDYIAAMVNSNVVVGYDDGTFLPNKNVTRAEYVKMIVGQFGLTETVEAAFGDVIATDWYAEYVNKAVAAGLVEGDGGNFRPNDTITRQDAAVILYRLGIKGGETEIEFADDADVTDYAKDAVDTLASAGIINGSDGNFNPKNAITRAETAAIICRAADKVVADAETEEEPIEEEETETPVEGEEAETPAEDEDAEAPAEDEEVVKPEAEEDEDAPAEGEDAVTEENAEDKSEEAATE